MKCEGTTYHFLVEAEIQKCVANEVAIRSILGDFSGDFCLNGTDGFRHFFVKQARTPPEKQATEHALAAHKRTKMKTAKNEHRKKKISHKFSPPLPHIHLSRKSEPAAEKMKRQI